MLPVLYRTCVGSLRSEIHLRLPQQAEILKLSVVCECGLLLTVFVFVFISGTMI